MARAKPFKFPAGVLRRIREMTITNPVVTGLRNTLSVLRSGFFEAPTTPALRDTKINKDAARALYYNIDPNIRLGAFPAKNIINSTADYIGLPNLTIGDEQVDDIINGWIQDHWASKIWQLYRTTMRDADCWVRVRLPLPSPLLAPDEQNIPQIEIYDSDRITPYYNPTTQELERVEILTLVYIEDEPFDPAQIYATGVHVHGREHEIIEIITPEQYLYWDATTNNLLDNFTTTNEWRFVPMIQVFNDYDEGLHGGSSDLETVYPLFKPFNDILDQMRTAFKYHANPKVQIQVNDVMNFIRNNFPEAITSGGEYTGKVSWRDKDVFFMETGDSGSTNEQMSFVTTALNVAEAQALLDLIIDCMCIGAEVTEGVLLRARAEGAAEEEFDRFKKKIARKRDNFQAYLQAIIRISMYVALKNPKTAQISWPAIVTQDLIDEATAFNNDVTALEVLSRSQVISRQTYRASVRRYIPAMKSDAQEETDAQANLTQENQQQIDLQTKMANIPVPTTTGTNGGGGPNSARRVRAAVPLQVANPQPGE